MPRMENDNAADFSYRPRAHNHGLHTQAKSAAAAASTLNSLPQQLSSSSRPTPERHQPLCTSAASLQEHHQLYCNFPELLHDQRPQPGQSLLFHATQRRHSSTEYFTQHHSLSSLSEQPQQYQYRLSSPRQSLVSQQQELRSCLPTQASTQRYWPPFPHPKRLSDSARFHDYIARHPTCHWINSSSRNVRANWRHHSSGEARRIRGDGGGGNSSIKGAGRGSANNQENLSTGKGSAAGARSPQASSHGSPGDPERFLLNESINRESRTSTCSSRPSVNVSACIYTVGSWSSATLSGAEADAEGIHQSEEGATTPKGAAECAAAAVTQSAARAAAASATAQREARAVAAKSVRAGSPPVRRQAATVVTEAVMGVTPACARVSLVSRTPTTDGTDSARTRTSRTGEPMHDSTGLFDSSAPSNGQPALKARQRWRLGESIWATGLVKGSALAPANDEGTAMLTLSPELDHANASNAVVHPSAEVSADLVVADAPGLAAYNSSDAMASPPSAADAGGLGAFGVRGKLAHVPASCTTSSAAVPQLDSVVRRSPDAASAANSPVLLRAPPTAMSAAGHHVLSPRVAGVSGENDAVSAAGALESLFSWTREDDAYPAVTPKSRCPPSSPKTCYTSHFRDEVQHLLLLQEDEEPLLEEKKSEDEQLLVKQRDKLHTEEDLLQQPHTQHAQHWQQDKKTPQLHHPSVQCKQEQSRHPHVHHKPDFKRHEGCYHRQEEQQQQWRERRHSQRRRPQSENEADYHSKKEIQESLSQTLTSMPSFRAGDADVQPCEGACVIEQGGPPEQLSQQAHVTVSNTHHQRRSEQDALTYWQEQNTVQRNHQQLPLTTQHRQYRRASEHLHETHAPQQPPQRTQSGQSNSSNLRPSQETTEERKAEQNVPPRKRDEQEEDQEHQQELHPQQCSRQQGGLAGEGEDEQERSAGPCCQEKDSRSTEQAAVLKELQYLVQQQQTQLQQLVQQQTLMMQQLFHRQSVADLPVGHFAGNGRGVVTPAHLTDARNVIAEVLAAGGSAAGCPPPATFRVTTRTSPYAVSALGRSVPMTQAYAKTPHALAGTPLAGGTSNSTTVSAEHTYCVDTSENDRHGISGSGVFEQIRQCRISSQVAHSGAEISEKPVIPSQLNRRNDTNTLLQPVRAEDLRAKKIDQDRKLPKLKQPLQEDLQKTSCSQGEQRTEQDTLMQMRPQLRENPQRLPYTNNLDGQLEKAFGENRKDALYNSSVSVQMIAQPPPAWVSSQPQSCSTNPSPMHRAPCSAQTVPLKGDLPEAEATEDIPATRAANTAVQAASGSTRAEAPAAATPANTAEPRAAATDLVTGVKASAATAAAWRKERQPVQGAAASVNVQQQSDVNSSPVPSQQHRRRCVSTAATTGHHANSQSSSSSSISALSMMGTTLSRLSTSTSSDQQVQDHKEPSSPRMLCRQSFPLFGRTPGGGDEGTPLIAENGGAFVIPATAPPPSLVAAADLQQQPLSAPELLRQQQRELQRKLRLLQKRVQHVHHEQQQQNDHVTLENSFLSPQERCSIDVGSTVDQQLPLLLSNSTLQRVSQPQQCQRTPRKYYGAPPECDEYVQTQTTLGRDQGCNRGSTSGGTVLDDSRGSASCKDVLLRPSRLCGLNTATPGPLRSVDTYALPDECCLLAPAIPDIPHAHFLMEDEATAPEPLPRVAAVKPPPAGRTATTQLQKFPAHGPAQAVPAKLAPAAQSEETMPCSGDTYGLLTPASDSNAYFPACAYLSENIRPVAAGKALILSAASAPETSLPAKVDLSGVKHCFSAQSQSDAFCKSPTIRACYSDSVSDAAKENCIFVLDQICSPRAGGAARREQIITQEQHRRCTGGGIFMQDLMQHRTGEEEGAGEPGERVQPRGLRPGWLKPYSGQKPTLMFFECGNRLQPQDQLQGNINNSVDLQSQQVPRRILDQDEQIVPSVLKRILLQQQQQQQQEMLGKTDEKNTFPDPSALQQHQETCWWEEAALSKTAVRQQQRHQLQSQQLTTSRRNGACRAAAINGRPTARLCTQKDAVRPLASRQQPSAHQRPERRKAFAPCCSITQASTTSSGKHISGASSNPNVDSKQNNNCHSRTNSCESGMSGQSSAGRATKVPQSPNSKPKTAHLAGSRARELQQKLCSRRQYIGDQSAAVPLAARNLMQPKTHWADGSCKSFAATHPRTDSGSVTSSEVHEKRHVNPSDVVATDQCRSPKAHVESFATPSRVTVSSRSVGEDYLPGPSNPHNFRACVKPERSFAFNELIDEEGGRSGRHPRHNGGDAHFDEKEKTYYAGSSRCSQGEQNQRGDTSISNNALQWPRPLEDKEGRVVDDTVVERRNEEARAPSGAPPKVTQSRQQEKQPPQSIKNFRQMLPQHPVRRMSETSQAHRQIRPARQQPDLDVEKHGAGHGADNELHPKGKASYTRLLRFLDQRSRPARGQETAALVRLFLSQQGQLPTAAAAAPGCKWDRSIGNGISSVGNDSSFCVEHLKHLREDSAGDAYYVETMAKLLQRYEELTTVD